MRVGLCLIKHPIANTISQLTVLLTGFKVLQIAHTSVPHSFYGTRIAIILVQVVGNNKEGGIPYRTNPVGISPSGTWNDTGNVATLTLVIDKVIHPLFIHGYAIVIE